MNYKQVYNHLIDRAVDRSWDRSTAPCYVELHHVVPKCLGGSDEGYNVVCLTAREHFIAHLLLVKIYPTEHKLIHAAHMLTRGAAKHDRVGNREYEWLKQRRAHSMSVRQKGIPKSDQHKENLRGRRPHVNQTGSNNNAFKGYIQTPHGVFESLKAAADVEGVDLSTVHYRIHSKSEKFTEYKRLPL